MQPKSKYLFIRGVKFDYLKVVLNLATGVTSLH